MQGQGEDFSLLRDGVTASLGWAEKLADAEVHVLALEGGAKIARLRQCFKLDCQLCVPDLQWHVLLLLLPPAWTPLPERWWLALK